MVRICHRISRAYTAAAASPFNAMEDLIDRFPLHEHKNLSTFNARYMARKIKRNAHLFKKIVH